jgi:ethanolamine ammonia-lyase large subunit
LLKPGKVSTALHISEQSTPGGPLAERHMGIAQAAAIRHGAPDHANRPAKSRSWQAAATKRHMGFTRRKHRAYILGCMGYAHRVGATSYRFADLKDLLAKATPPRSGDVLAGVAAASSEQRMAARMALADLPLARFLSEAIVPYEIDEVTRLIVDTHDAAAFAPLSTLTVGELRDWLLADTTSSDMLAAAAPGITPEMAAGVAKLMRNQDLILVAKKCRVVTRFRNTLGLPGHLAVRLQPNHPTDDARGIAASMFDGLLYGCGDAVIGINPAGDALSVFVDLWRMMDELITRFSIPTQSCVLTHVTNQIRGIEAGAPVDLVFQSVAGTEAANRGFGIDLAILKEAREAALSLKRGTVGDNVMYFETGQGSALSAGAHHGADQQTLEARAYGVARHFKPLLTNTVVGFIGPEYLYDGKQIIRAGLEDHFCGKLLGLPLGVDVCYTNHAEADQDDMDNLLTLLGVAGVTFIMGVPGADDIMLNYQSTSFHDALYVREALGLRRAPEFEAWLRQMRIVDAAGRLLPAASGNRLLGAATDLGSQ